MDHSFFHSPFGPIMIKANESHLLAVQFVESPTPKVVDSKNPIINETKQQLSEYFSGQRTEFDLPLVPTSESFMPRVWRALQKIPYGETRTYGAIAKQLQSPGAARAVGMACHKNPWLIVVPCHRILAADGGLGGFALDLAIKQNLLSHESTHIPK